MRSRSIMLLLLFHQTSRHPGIHATKHLRDERHGSRPEQVPRPVSPLLQRMACGVFR